MLRISPSVTSLKLKNTEPSTMIESNTNSNKIFNRLFIYTSPYSIIKLLILLERLLYSSEQYIEYLRPLVKCVMVRSLHFQNNDTR